MIGSCSRSKAPPVRFDLIAAENSTTTQRSQPSAHILRGVFEQPPIPFPGSLLNAMHHQNRRVSHRRI
jgi:hypothetical protein